MNMAINMENQVLSIEQMNHLKELGVDTSGASMYYELDDFQGFYRLYINEDHEHDRKEIPAFTLQDTLEIMPKQLKIKVEEYRSPVDCLLMIDVANDCIYYEYTAWGERGCGNTFGGVNLLTSAYEMLCWLAENDYLNKK